MSRVFIVQQQHRLDRKTGNLIPKFPQLHALAEKFGEPSYLLSPTASPFNPGSIIPELHGKLRDFGSSDYLLLVGNPCLIGWAVAAAAMNNDGRVTLLQWHGREQNYTQVVADMLEGYQPI